MDINQIIKDASNQAKGVSELRTKYTILSRAYTNSSGENLTRSTVILACLIDVTIELMKRDPDFKNVPMSDLVLDALETGIVALSDVVSVAESAIKVVKDHNKQFNKGSKDHGASDRG